MKLINEQNWKQEIARLKADRILLHKEHDMLFNKIKEAGCTKHLMLELNVYMATKEKIDKAIETIENVFVHKQCWIDN